MKRKFDRLWDERVQQERMRQGRERAQEKREIALARRALQDRFEPCRYFSLLRSTLAPRTHHWRRRNSDTEECIFCNRSRPHLGSGGAFDAASSSAFDAAGLGAYREAFRYRDGNKTTISTEIKVIYPPLKGAKGPWRI
jgi:hypothetical protein